jgi:hypothetical protein
MLNLKFIKDSIKFICGFLLGTVFVFMLAFKNPEEQLYSKPSFEFGDVKFAIEDFKLTVDDANVLEKPIVVDEVLRISKDNYPFILLYKDPSGKICYFAICDGENELALSRFKGGRISEFFVFGNKVHDNSRMQVFFIMASDKPGIWKKALYAPNCKKIIKNGKHISYAPNGELYYDIDFDGQFDAKCIMNEKKEILSESIYIGKQWIELFCTDSDEKLIKNGYFSLEKLEAMMSNGENIIYYDFEFGKGWRERSSENAS